MAFVKKGKSQACQECSWWYCSTLSARNKQKGLLKSYLSENKCIKNVKAANKHFFFVCVRTVFGACTTICQLSKKLYWMSPTSCTLDTECQKTDDDLTHHKQIMTRHATSLACHCPLRLSFIAFNVPKRRRGRLGAKLISTTWYSRMRTDITGYTGL